MFLRRSMFIQNVRLMGAHHLFKEEEFVLGMGQKYLILSILNALLMYVPIEFGRVEYVDVMELRGSNAAMKDAQLMLIREEFVLDMVRRRRLAAMKDVLILL